ncbi:pseudouridine-5'-phosphate glycosidase [Ahrensia sp. R2A130]|uniref:pseudouridine-5'-phosphate glycosidase n=1 Tax=Ahrensia sp. R2A130 TaxID=744979 RepID=UPI0001E09BF0|nr:pseudouridine-5'-phosphate glycosidase [Ahrensia sp. R2A130]EFL90014.1 protein YeiN [Ahrensia sp. R2A130]
MTQPQFTASPDVAAALAEGRPVVALESTIITHGMPWPENVETARQVEETVRAGGAVPATIAILDGQLRIGLTDEELVALGQAKDVMKLSRADLAFAVTMGRTGSTTVAATMICAALAGIEVFATGGIGGVHRGAEDSFDISADLIELARTPVTVVCAGAKAILDLPKTFEVLETQGVPVVGYRCDELPAFWSRESGLPSPLRMDEAIKIARHMADRKALSLGGGMLVTNPVPEADAIAADVIGAHIEAALTEANQQNITGKGVTPFLLGRMVELTDGASLVTNKALILNNAALAAEIAVAAVTI